MIRVQRQRVRDCCQQPPQLAGIEMAGRTAAEKDRLDPLRRPQCGKLRRQCFDVEINLMILPGRHGEITVAAMMRAKRNMDVSGPRPKPGRSTVAVHTSLL